MGKPTGFLEYERETGREIEAKERLSNFREFHLPLSPEAQQRQGARCMDCGVPFCQSGMLLNGMVSGCPLHNLIPEWNDLVYRGKWELAIKRLLKTNNFPEFTSRVCPAPCEAACTSGLNGAPVSIKENENRIIELAFERGVIQPEPPKLRTGKTVAVIGSGPSGLACAAQLNRRGHLVTVFERSDRPGGLLMYGIPNMKLEKEIVNRRIHLMEAEGIQFRTGADIGKNIAAEELLEQFDAVVLCCGASSPRDLNVPGREAKGIYFAVDFLRSTTKSLLDGGLAEDSFLSAKDKNVLVIGGGDTGNDCVGTALRHGCKSITQLEMLPAPPETRSENNTWPEWPRVLKTDYGQQEAIHVFGSDPRIYCTTVHEFLADEKGWVQEAVIDRLKWEKKENGKMACVPIEGEAFSIKTELVLLAAGFLGSENYIAEAFGVERDARSNIAAQNYATNIPKVFTAGDMHRGQSLVVWAIQEGREAAAAVDTFLMGYTN